MNWHSMSIEAVEENLNVDSQKGLSSRQAEEKLSHGKNILIEKKRKNPLLRFAAQFQDFMVIVLIVAAAVSLGVSIIQGEKDFIDPIIIMIIVFLNAILGFLQENKAEKALEALKKLSAPKALILRDGEWKKIDAENIVVGDVIKLETGDFVPADARLISAINLCAEEAALTGESDASVKQPSVKLNAHAPLGERVNMVYSGSCIVAGRGQALVIATGMNTEMGKIAELIMVEKNETTPLQLRLEETGRFLGIAALFICLIIFILGLIRHISVFEMFMTSVSLAVAAIPEGLPAIVTIMLAIGVERMAARNAIIRKLPAVEALGSATVICSDKTGTLTQNKMKVVEVCCGEKRNILTIMCLCNNSEYDRKNQRFIGEPTEAALAEAAFNNGIRRIELEKKYPRTAELPFDSKRKLMSTVHKDGNTYLIAVKGAFEVLLDKCSKYYENGMEFDLTNRKRSELQAKADSMAERALRVMAAAYREKSSVNSSAGDNVESGLVFCGLVGMMDPPREEVYEAVKVCRQARIKPVMITGDHAATALAVAQKTGIATKGSGAVTGVEINAMTQEELEKKVKHYSVFARVSPEHKVRIIKAFKKNGEIVAMTGDGVNDAPALKCADIGCAMGITGTDVAKSAADIVLADDNFATIVAAVKEGRGIFDNIKKAVHFLLSSNIGEIITILAAMIIGFTTPLAPIQLLWINLVTDSLPAIALGLEPPESGIMNGGRRQNGKSLFSGGLWARIGLEGIMIGMLALLAFGIGSVFFDSPGTHKTGSTMAFSVLSISQLVHAFNMKSEKSIFEINLFDNPYLIISLVIGVILQVSVIMIPTLAVVFKVCGLSAAQWLIVTALCLVPIAIVELEKSISR